MRKRAFKKRSGIIEAFVIPPQLNADPEKGWVYYFIGPLKSSLYDNELKWLLYHRGDVFAF